MWSRPSRACASPGQRPRLGAKSIDDGVCCLLQSRDDTAVVPERLTPPALSSAGVCHSRTCRSIVRSTAPYSLRSKPSVIALGVVVYGRPGAGRNRTSASGVSLSVGREIPRFDYLPDVPIATIHERREKVAIAGTLLLWRWRESNPQDVPAERRPKFQVLFRDVSERDGSGALLGVISLVAQAACQALEAPEWLALSVAGRPLPLRPGGAPEPGRRRSGWRVARAARCRARASPPAPRAPGRSCC